MGKLSREGTQLFSFLFPFSMAINTHRKEFALFAVNSVLYEWIPFWTGLVLQSNLQIESHRVVPFVKMAFLTRFYHGGQPMSLSSI